METPSQREPGMKQDRFYYGPYLNPRADEEGQPTWIVPYPPYDAVGPRPSDG